ncbi:hypothetical protein EI690_06780 [Klebsiella pneumoniae]|nr:hypothetical protein EI690_06780 [Klebsiella pneumoniae]
MNIIKTDIPEVLIFEPRVFGDARGFFFESFSSKVFNEAVGRQVEFVQDNHSQSQKGVLRGLHYQLDPHAQGKLVRCVEGEVFDVAVDIRRSSPTYFRTTDVTGTIELPEGVEMVMPGDNIKMVVTLIHPIAMDDGLRFAIREGGRTVGAGVVAKVLG